MSKRRGVSRAFAAACLGCGILVSANGASEARQETPPCAGPVKQCPAPISFPTFVRINLEPDSSSVCRFNPQVVDDLSLEVGDNVQWNFCNACPTDMVVELSTTQPGPFTTSVFQVWRPMPTADNLLTVEVPCQSEEDAYGVNALVSGDWKYTLRGKPEGSQMPSDTIDPRLEIDDRGFAPAIVAVLSAAVAAAVGVAIGFLLARRRHSGPTARA